MKEIINMAKIKCPFCSEEIDERSVRCGYCGKNPKNYHGQPISHNESETENSITSTNSEEYNNTSRQKQQIIGQQLRFVRTGIILRNSPTEITFNSDSFTVKKALSKKEVRYSSITSVERKNSINGMNLMLGIALALLALVLFSGGEPLFGIIGAVGAILNFVSMRESAMIIKASADSMTVKFRRNSEEANKFIEHIEIMRKAD